MKCSGLIIGILEILSFVFFSSKIRHHYDLYSINSWTYYWLMMTVLTGIWEFTFISNYKKVNKRSQQLINNKQNVWTNKYNLWYILPWNLAKIFYAEYGAYADREYMTIKDE